MPTQEYPRVALSEETKSQLDLIGHKKETYEEIVLKLIKRWEEKDE